MKLNESFGTIPDHYDKSRLKFPTPLFRDVLKYAELGKRDAILEIGIGTGIATPPFARLGNPLMAVDISRELIAFAKKKLKQYKNIHYRVGAFEQVRLAQNKFQLLFAAQTYHWIDPAAQFTKPLQVLKPGGTLALFWNYNWYDRGLGKIALVIHKKYSRAKSSRSGEIIKRLTNHPKYKDQVYREYYWNAHLTKRQYLNMQTSYSWYLTLSPERQKVALAEFTKLISRYPKIVTLPMRTKLVMARKI